MFTRHLKKFNNTAEMEAAIRDGLVASPYVIFNADRNTANMVLPDGKEAAEIEYEPWMTPYLVSNMYTADPSNGEYTDPSGNFLIYYDEDERESGKYVDNLYFYLNSQYLEGWGSTAEFIENDTAGGSNTPIILITEKNALDNTIEYWSNHSGYSESKTLSDFVYQVIDENKELRYDDIGGKTRTWLVNLSDGAETSFWGEDIEYCISDAASLEGYYMQPDNNEGHTPEYYILVAYQKEDESLMASKDNILRAAIDTESMYKVYKAGIFRAYDYSEEGDDTPDASEGSVRIVGDITPEYTRDTVNSYGNLTAFIHFNIEADAIENQDMAYGQYGWPFIYMSQKEEFDNHKQGYMTENPGASDLDYIYAVISGEVDCRYYQLGTDEEEFLPIDLSGEFSWPDSSVAYYTYDELAVPPPYDSHPELAGTYYIFAVYTDGEWNPVSPRYSDAYVDLGEYEIESHIVDSSSLVTGSGAINGETIGGTTDIRSRHQDFNLSVTPNSIFDKVMVGVYTSSYYNSLLEDYMNNQAYSEEAARDAVLSQMCTQRLELDGTYYSADSSVELVDNVNVSPSYTGYDDTLVLSGYCYSSTSNDRTEWLDFTTQQLSTVNLFIDVVSFDTTLSRAEISFTADANPIYDKVRFFICTNGYYDENEANYGWDWHAFAVDKVGNSSSTAVLDANNNYSNTAYVDIVEGVNAESGYDGSVRVLNCYARLESSDGSIVSDVTGIIRIL